MKIPTIFGISLLITVVSLGLILYSFQKNADEKLKKSAYPLKIEVINLTNSKATIVWQTNIQTEGKLILKKAGNVIGTKTDDHDDPQKPKPRLVHIVTLTNLTDQSKYSYQIQDSRFTYPQEHEFQTPAKLTELADAHKPSFIQGTVLNTNLNPIDEALVILKLEGATMVGSVTGTAGNYIIALNNLRTADYKNPFNLATQSNAVLSIERPDSTSTVQFKFPLSQYNLPPITVGQNLNLEAYLASQSARLQNDALKFDRSLYDQNNDAVINSLDLAIVAGNANKKVFDKKSDLNSDSQVDQKDVDTLKKSL